MDISRYTGFFHDGDLIDFKHVGDKMEISMMSAEILPEDMIENMPPLKRNSIVGKLYLEGVKKVTVDGELFGNSLKKTHDSVTIFDFEVLDRKVILSMDWINYHPRRTEPDFSTIEIEAASICWENATDFSKDRPEYIGYFLGGRLTDLVHCRDPEQRFNLVQVSMQGEKISPEPMSPLSKKIMTGRLELEGVKKVKMNGKRFNNLLKKKYDSGKIVDFEIFDHKLTLGVQWINHPPHPKTSDFSKIEIEADIFYWENMLDFSEDMSNHTPYFLRGRLLDFNHFENELRISMKTVMLEGPPVNEKFILGKLYLEGIRSIKINDKLFSETLKKTSENGEILDLKVLDHKLLLVIQWSSGFPKSKSTLSKIEIEAELIYWESVLGVAE